MSDSLLYASFVLLASVVIALCCTVMIIMNKLMNPHRKGVLLQSNHGISIGESFPKLSIETLDGLLIPSLTGEIGSVVLITSPGCGTCKELYPVIPRVAGMHPEMLFISLMVGNKQAVEAIVNDYSLAHAVAIIGQNELHAMKTEYFPFAYLLSPEGKVLSKGIVVNEEHLQILLKPLLHPSKKTWISGLPTLLSRKETT